MFIPNLLFRRPLEQANRDSRPDILFRRFLACAISRRPGDVHAEGDAEDCRVGILRREGRAGIAHQVGRHGADRYADYE